jgi:hypothetical protein
MRSLRLARLACAISSMTVLVAMLCCGGERLPVSSARPEGSKWWCAQGSYVACGRDAAACASENAQVGSRIVGAGDPPRADECKEQPLATCYTYVDASSHQAQYDCFRDRGTCETYRKEAERAPTQYAELSVCGTWD